MPTGGVDYNTRTKEQLIELIEMIQRDRYKLEEENRKLKEDNRFLTKISKEYMKKENIVEVTEFTELYKDNLEKELEEKNEFIDDLRSSIKWNAIKDIIFGILILIWYFVESGAFR